MNENLETYIKTLIPFKQELTFKQQFPASKQASILDELLSMIAPENDENDAALISKLCIHFLKYGANDQIKNDAFTSQLMLKSFSIKQNKPALQHYCFMQGFQLLYSRYLRQDQIRTYIEELNEFAHSQNTRVLLDYFVFHFDTKANPNFSIFKQEPKSTHVSNTVPHLCAIFELIHKESITNFPTLNHELPEITLETVQQRFMNQLVYGPFGLQSTPYNLERSKPILQTLINCLQTPIQHMSQKALTKHMQFLDRESKKCEQNNNADALIAYDEDISFIKPYLQPA